MKKRILTGLASLVLFFLIGTLVVVYYITNTTERMDRLILLHQIEILREDLVIHLQQVQSNIPRDSVRNHADVDSLVSHIQEMDTVLDSCLGCHHAPEPAKGIAGLRAMAADYKIAIGSLITASPDSARVKELERRARELGQELLARTQGMAFTANVRLQQKTKETMITIRKIRGILYGTLVIGFLLAIAIALMIARDLDAKIGEVISAMRHITCGELEHRLIIEDGKGSEFRKLAEGFNAMAKSLQQSKRRDVQTAKLAALGDFAANVAYEVNNPLNGVLSYTQLLLRNDDIPIDKKEHLKTIERETLRAHELLHDMVRIVRRNVPHIENISLGSVLQDTLQLVQGSARASNVNVELLCPPSLPPIAADKNELKRVFATVIKNALIFMPGGGTLTVTCLEDKNVASSSRVITEFADTGFGIPEEQLNRLFDPFPQTGSQQKGARFGLAISYMIVQSYGGSMEVESRVGEGSRFRVTFPVVG